MRKSWLIFLIVIFVIIGFLWIGGPLILRRVFIAGANKVEEKVLENLPEGISREYVHKLFNELRNQYIARKLDEVALKKSGFIDSLRKFTEDSVFTKDESRKLIETLRLVVTGQKGGRSD